MLPLVSMPARRFYLHAFGFGGKGITVPLAIRSCAIHMCFLMKARPDADFK